MIQTKLWKLHTLMVLAMTTWGLSWTNAKLLGLYADAPLLSFWRFAIASICFFFIVNTKVSLKITFSSLPLIILNSIFIVMYNYFYFKGTKIGLAGVGGVLVTTMNPILTTIFSSLILQEAVSKKGILGLFFGLVAGSLIIRAWELDINSFYNSGNLFFILASLSWVAVTLITSWTKEKIPFLSYSFWTFSVAAIIILPFVPLKDIFSVFYFDLIFWINLIILSVFAMAFGTSIYFYASTQLGPKKASSYIFLVPITAIFFSMYFLKEPFQISIILGGFLGFFSVYLINSN